MTDDDERFLEQLGDALRPATPSAAPAPDRVAALRAAALAHRTAADRPEVSVARPGGPARPSRRGLLGLGVAAAAGALAGIGVREALQDDAPEPPYQDVAFDPPPAGVSIASSRIIDHTWGVELLLDVEGLPAGETHLVRFVGRDGVLTGAGGFIGVEGPFLCRCNGPRRAAELSAIEVLGPDDAVVLRASLL